MKTTHLLSWLAGLPLAAAALAAEPPTPDSAAFSDALSTALRQHLAAHGDICLGKADWPIDVSVRDMQLASRDAVQMPVLERAGLVSSERLTLLQHDDDGERPVQLTRYRLTPAGAAFYLRRAAPAQPDGAAPTPAADFCAGHLTLDQLAGWSAPDPGAARPATTARYTYRFDAAPWARMPEVEAAFPMVARLIAGEHSLQLAQRFQFVDGRWQALAP